MALTTYADLKAEIATFLNRANLTTLIPDFVTMANTRIHYGSEEAPFKSEPLRIRAMETSVNTSIATQTIALPTRFLQARRFYLNSNPIRKLDYITPDQFWETYVSSNSGAPSQYTIEGENILIGPIPDGTYTGELLYYEAFAALSDETDTNWLLTNAPGAYLHGALIEAHRYTRNREAQQDAYNAFVGIINSLMYSDHKDRSGGAPWVIRSDVGNP